MDQVSLPEMVIRPYTSQDENAVIEIWNKCNLLRPWNDPHQDILRKMKVNPELFLVGLIDDKIAVTAMGGYEGHRGWVNYLATDPIYQKRGLARKMMEVLHSKLLDLGCPKINLQVRRDNLSAIEFYKKIGYQTDEAVSMGKRLIKDEP